MSPEPPGALGALGDHPVGSMLTGALGDHPVGSMLTGARSMLTGAAP
ncbi:hypothetical protein ACFVS9_09815 [Streptomyces sp. NPDC058008]